MISDRVCLIPKQTETEAILTKTDMIDTLLWYKTSFQRHKLLKRVFKYNINVLYSVKPHWLSVTRLDAIRSDITAIEHIVIVYYLTITIKQNEHFDGTAALTIWMKN